MIRENLKISIYYKGSRNKDLEAKLDIIAPKYGGNRAGEWGYSDMGFSCMFRFKKDIHFQNFKRECQSSLGFDYNKILFGSL